MMELLDATSRTVATYDFGEAARYLRLPQSTVRAWVCGQAGFEPLIAPASSDRPMLSFTNLVEIHMLAAIRRTHEIKMANVRAALDRLGGEHPLARHDLETDGVDLFVRCAGELVNLSRPRQQAIAEVMNAYLRRIRWEDGEAAVLFPFASDRLDGRKSVMIDPRISFGRLVMSGTGIPVDIIVERFKAGDSVEELARDYRQERLRIEDVLRFETPLAA